MEVFAVGGCVRDILLGHPLRDMDYVVVGATHDDMINQGFTQVGSSFPVYLHPVTRDEYALARTERKIGLGYSGFSTNTDGVLLTSDQMRRDVTINSMAVHVNLWDKFCKTRDQNLVVDPFNGLSDLKNKVLRHTSEAFSEDPIRVLRTARFAARYSEFIIDHSTLDLMEQVAPELAHVPAERIWVEVEKGLKETHFIRMFDALDLVEVFDRVEKLKPFKKYNQRGTINPTRIDTSSLSTVQRFSLIAHGFADVDYDALCVPTEYTRFSKILNSVVIRSTYYNTLSPVNKLLLMTDMRVFNDLNTVTTMLRDMFSLTNWWIDSNFTADIEKVLKVNTSDIAAQFKNGKQIAEAIKQARIDALT